MRLRLAHLFLTCAYVVLSLGLIPLLGDPVFTRTWLWTLTAAALVAMLFTRAEWRRDRRDSAVVLLALLALPFFASGAVVALFDGAVRLKALGVTLLCAGLGAFLGIALWRELHRVDGLPHNLAARFPADSVFEDDGVEWALEALNDDVAERSFVRIQLQNNVDAERIVTLRLRDELPKSGRRGTLRFGRLEPIRLPAAADATVFVPVVANERTARDAIRVYAELNATGPSGPRNRRKRADSGPRPLSRIWVVLGALTGHWIFKRGGVFITVRSSGTSITDQALPAAEVRIAEAER
jgi:hypothetical protein